MDRLFTPSCASPSDERPHTIQSVSLGCERVDYDEISQATDQTLFASSLLLSLLLPLRRHLLRAPIIPQPSGCLCNGLRELLHRFDALDKLACVGPAPHLSSFNVVRFWHSMQLWDCGACLGACWSLRTDPHACSSTQGASWAVHSLHQLDEKADRQRVRAALSSLTSGFSDLHICRKVTHEAVSRCDAVEVVPVSPNFPTPVNDGPATAAGSFGSIRCSHSLLPTVRDG